MFEQLMQQRKHVKYPSLAELLQHKDVAGGNNSEACEPEICKFVATEHVHVFTAALRISKKLYTLFNWFLLAGPTRSESRKDALWSRFQASLKAPSQELIDTEADAWRSGLSGMSWHVILSDFQWWSVSQFYQSFISTDPR